jgi:uncharacterized membrane protein
MKKIIMLMFGILLVLSLGLISAHEHNLDEAKQLIDSEISCDKLTDEQFEMIGEYYMEQMHPGEAHEMMDKMMGGEGSDSLKQMHIQMAKRLYCNEDVGGMMSSSRGMMGMMNMMGGNMMDSGGITGNNMMDNSIGSSLWWLWNIVGILFWIALLVALILLIVWLYKKIAGKPASNGSALEILKKRHAKGEINKREYESIKKRVGE